MISIKESIRELIPSCFLDSIETLKLLKRFLGAEMMERRVGMDTVSFFTDEEAVDMICNRRMSLSRFGDGEFRWMLEKQERSFQKCSTELAKMLIQAFQNDNPHLLIGIPIGMFQPKGCKLYARIWWKIVKWELFSNIIPYVNYSKVYCNASLTRPYIDYVDWDFSRRCFENIRRIWNGRECVFVEGENTKLGVGNDLFDNAKSISRILCPAKNAFEKINEIEAAIREYVHKDCLILCALGPTASIMAAHMCAEGYQLVDIGHIDIEYIWFLRKAKRREPVSGKHVNECRRQMTSCDPDPIEYTDSIVKIVK